MSPHNRDVPSKLDGQVRWRTVLALLGTILGSIVLLLGFAMHNLIIPFGFGFAGISVGVGGTYLWKTKVSPPADHVQSRPTNTAASGEHPSLESEQDPIAVLEMRYARGDIDDTEFERRLERLLEVDSGDDRRPNRHPERFEETGF